MQRHICLDVGCGSGRSYAFRPHCPVHTETILLDVEFPERWIVKLLSARPSLHFVVASAEKLPFRSTVFTMIYMWHVLEHTDCDICCLREIHRVARQGAEIHLAVPSIFSIDCIVDPTHRHCYTVLTLSRTARKIGLKVSLVHRAGSRLPRPLRWLLNILFNYLADHIQLRLTK